jgi:hypothetical protein
LTSSDHFQADGDEPTHVIYGEFQQCNSEYAISDKDDESEISSDGEFNDAAEIDIFSEDNSRIDEIEYGKKTNRFLNY